jgi:phage gp37-like protein
MKQVLVNKTITEKQHNRHAIFIMWFGQVTLAYFHVVASQWTRVTLNPFQVIQ